MPGRRRSNSAITEAAMRAWRMRDDIETAHRFILETCMYLPFTDFRRLPMILVLIFGPAPRAA